MVKLDQELMQYRDMMKVPDTFEDGFNLSSFLGVFFIAIVMVPGALYMELVAGMGLGNAAQWVTVILFIEIAKRANAKLSRAQLFILFYLSGTIVSQHVHGTPLFTQFVVQSEAALSFGLDFPHWVAPSDPEVLMERSFFQWQWAPAIGLIAFKMFFSRFDNAVLGYGLYRVTSDIEKLPFPLAPMGAQGMLALAEDLEGQKGGQASWRWRVFSIGGAIGLVFAFIYMGVPMLTNAIFDKPLTMLPIPFIDLTSYTDDFLPAVATGLSFDLGQLIMGMVMPYWAMIGSFVAIMMTYILNPILYSAELLPSWNEGDNTVLTLFHTNVDFYFSFLIGLSMAVAVVGLSAIFRLGKKPAAVKNESNEIPEGRGDIPPVFIVAVYLGSSAIFVLLSGYLINWHPAVMAVLLFFAFVYTPLISYVTARLEGMAGQMVEIPFIRELAFIFSGYQGGTAVWFLPLPKANYGIQTVLYRKAELLGTRFVSIWKADVFLFPVIILATIGFSSFIWSLGPVPGPAYPYAQEIWEFEAKNQCLIFSSTSGELSEFEKALTLPKVASGFGTGLLIFGALTFFSAPMTMLYGFVRGIGQQAMPHIIIPQFIGAIIGKFYFERKMGTAWKKYVLVLAAGYFVGAGLISMFCMGIVFLLKSTSATAI